MRNRWEHNGLLARWTGMPFVLLYLVVEIVALVALVSWIGIGWTVLVLLAGSVLGLWLARREGLRALRAMAEAARERRVAHVEVTDGLLIAIGGLLLIVPGLVTDVAGLLLLLQPTRALVRRRMVRDAERRAPLLRTARLRADGTVVDGEVVTPYPGGPLGERPALPRVVHGEAHVVEGGVVDGAVVDGSVVDAEVVEGATVDGQHAVGDIAVGDIADGDIVDGEIVDDGPAGSRPLAS